VAVPYPKNSIFRAKLLAGCGGHLIDGDLRLLDSLVVEFEKVQKCVNNARAVRSRSDVRQRLWANGFKSTCACDAGEVEVREGRKPEGLGLVVGCWCLWGVDSNYTICGRDVWVVELVLICQ
jgi:hypothetical protein